MEGIVLPIVCEEDKYMPALGNPTDACFDIKARIPMGDGKITIEPGEVVKIGAGIKAAVPQGYSMKIYVRSSTGIKKNLELANGTGIIDAGYRDEIIMALHNFGKTPQVIQDGDRICQYEIEKIVPVQQKRVQDDEEFRNGDRGGGIGSTGTK